MDEEPDNEPKYGQRSAMPPRPTPRTPPPVPEKKNAKASDIAGTVVFVMIAGVVLVPLFIWLVRGALGQW